MSFTLIKSPAAPPPRRLVGLDTSSDRANGCSGFAGSLHMCYDQMQSSDCKMSFIFTVQQHIVVHVPGWIIGVRIRGGFREGIHSIAFVFSVGSESIPFLPSDFVYLAGNMWGGWKVELLWACLFSHESHFFLFRDVFISASWWNFDNIMWYCSPDVHVWYTGPLFLTM